MLIIGALTEIIFKTPVHGLNVKERTFHILGDGTKFLTLTNLPDIGKYAVAILTHAELTKNADVLVSSFEADYITIIAALEKVIGEKITVYNETPEEQLNYGIPDYLVDLRSMLQGGAGVMDRGGYKLWNDKFPEVKPGTLEEATRRALKEIGE
jgi:hypothetical protein